MSDFIRRNACKSHDFACSMTHERAAGTGTVTSHSDGNRIATGSIRTKQFVHSARRHQDENTAAFAVGSGDELSIQ